MKPINDDEAIYRGWVEYLMRRNKSVIIRKCDVCGHEFEASSRRHIYCSKKCQDAHFNNLKRK